MGWCSQLFVEFKGFGGLSWQFLEGLWENFLDLEGLRFWGKGLII